MAKEEIRCITDRTPTVMTVEDGMIDCTMEYIEKGKQLKRIMRKKMIYSLYRGDTFIGVGNAEELARMIDVDPNTISWMSGPTYKKRSGNSNRRLVVDKLGYDTDLDEEEKMDKYRFNKKELQRLIKRATYHMEHATVESAKKKWTLIKEKLETDPFRLGKDEIASILHWERFSLRTAVGEDRKFKEALIEKLERMLI